MSEILGAKNLCKSYFDGGRELRVLRGVNLKINKGEIAFVVGPSGVGKSTLLHLLGALDRPTAGEVRLNGIDVYGMRERERARLRCLKIGFVFQFYHLLPEFSAWENVLMPALISNKGQRAAGKVRALELLVEIGLRDRVHHRPSQLSGGESQRVAIARALINEPELILADEPTGNLDEGSSQVIMELIRELNEKRRQTFVIATHQEGLAQEGKERVIQLADGEAIEE
ncbi:ABC transporter ATP-binding protein [bacterium]|nr:ABC transporter ATP-binding protein [bacterium]